MPETGTPVGATGVLRSFQSPCWAGHENQQLPVDTEGRDGKSSSPVGRGALNGAAVLAVLGLHQEPSYLLASPLLALLPSQQGGDPKASTWRLSLTQPPQMPWGEQLRVIVALNLPLPAGTCVLHECCTGSESFVFTAHLK